MIATTAPRVSVLSTLRHTATALHVLADRTTGDEAADLRRRASDLTAARASLEQLISIARAFDGLIGGRALPDHVTVHRVDIRALDFYRLQQALASVSGGAA